MEAPIMPPHDTHAERLLLSALLREPNAVAWLCLESEVGVGDFFNHAHQVVYHAAWECIGADVESGLVGVWAVLRGTGAVAEWGGWKPAGVWLGDLWLETVSLWDDFDAAVCDAAGRVKQASLRREVIHRAYGMLADARDGCYAPGHYAGQLRVV